ncbi:CLUMA_CG000188, isoform A [Clunio marinus]|uniref:General transcription factor IIE subunit 1 n=1 Tax=Clunio marinus TaxID=568069 RepID=A0A1J1HIE7_9DIPT|nr:CLUMA_CG000188, isoform A [Clunio marinus]
MSEQLVTEVPSSLKQLARFVVRGFYTIEDALIIDMLVRNPCLREEDIGELLKFEKKQLRARLTELKNDKFIHSRLKMETGPDGKAHKVNYYFINYKTFVNVIKYKLDLMRKRLETEERDATSRASFKCTNCSKAFTDLEVDQLFDFNTGEFSCLFCGNAVVEDLSAMPKKDSRLMLARFNEQLQPLYDLLREVEGIKLAPEVLEPEPVDIDFIRGIAKPNDASATEVWSGEATRSGGFAVEETRVNITIGDADATDSLIPKKERPIWMTESTVVGTNDLEDQNDPESLLEKVAQTSSQSNSWSNSKTSSSSTKNKKENEENIMSVLLAHEKQTTKANTDAIKNLNTNDNDSSGDSSGDDDDEIDRTEIPDISIINDDDDSDDDVPTVMVGNKPYPVSEVMDNTDLIAKMSPHEKARYIQICQDYYEQNLM